MKKSSVLTAVLSLFVLSSCFSSNEPKEISPASTDFTDGGLAKLIEVVDEPCQLSYVEKEGEVESQYIMLNVKLRLTKESSDLQSVDPRDIDFTSMVSVATVDLVDENCIKLQELSVKSEDLLKLKKLLQGKVGDEETITFVGVFHDSDQAPEWFEQAAGIVPGVTGDISSPKVEQAEQLGLNLSGKFGGADDAVLTYDQATDDGVIEFTINGVKNVRKVKMGSYNKNTHSLILKEYYVNGKYVGDFDGVWKDGVYQGVFTNTKGGSVNFTLQGTGSAEFSGVSNSSYDNAESGSKDWDALLTSYEEYVDKSISYIKKAAKGDMTALAEYTSLMQKAQNLSDDLQDAKGDLSSSQLARFNKITMKMAKAAQDL
jgi:hypothetical protein